MLAALLLYKSHDNETGWSRLRGSVAVGGTFRQRMEKEEKEEGRAGERT